MSFSLDPEHDTPDTLRRFGQRLGADPLHWYFLTGSATDVRELLVDGFNLPLGDDWDFSGPGQEAILIDRLGAPARRMFLIDRLGRIRGSYDAAEADSFGRLRSDLTWVLSEIKPLPVPETIMTPSWLADRRRAQLSDAAGYRVLHDFSLQNRLEETGISFVNQVTEDSAKQYKTNHYDHGNGVAAADVDADGFMDLYFTSQIGTNELWRNLGEGRFENITEVAGVGLANRISVAASFGDVDNDGDPDLFVTSVRGGNALLVNDGAGRFKNTTEQAGLASRFHSSGSVFFDYDRDGLLDLFVTNVGRYTTDEVGPSGYYIGYLIAFDGHLKPERAERSILYRNLGGGRFEDVSEQTRLVEKGWNGDAAPLDLNQDGWTDLYITDMQGHDEYYENVGGQRFTDKSREVFPATPYGTMGIQVFDFDRDGRMDVYLTDMHTDMVRKFAPEEEKSKLPQDEMPALQILGSDGNHVRGNAFFRNIGDGRFEEISNRINAENYWPWGLSSGDLNADGFEDVFIAASMNYGWRYGVNSILLNEAGERFRDSEFILGAEPRRGGINAKPWFDLDCSEGDRDHFLCKDREGKHEVWGALGSRSSLIFDLEGDGDLDIVTNDSGSEPMVLMSDLSDRHPIRYLKVALVGGPSNRDGLGSTVTVRTGDTSYSNVYTGNSGYLSHSLLPLYFGLGDADKVDAIEILWPSGARQTVPGPIASNQLLTITEEQSREPQQR
ncbi:MAG: hypothetical protein GY769_24720 [bacterium]|nr:hypothetical protein [bacterium]